MLTIVALPSPVQVILLSDHVCLARLRFTSFFARLFTLSCLGTHLNYVCCLRATSFIQALSSRSLSAFSFSLIAYNTFPRARRAAYEAFTAANAATFASMLHWRL